MRKDCSPAYAELHAISVSAPKHPGYVCVYSANSLLFL